ncbi:MAG TPA: heat-shock protein [Alphaproteobacteria bacterium]|nr:heat-shock protein [Alphaproteobacteria bacterium]
MNANFSLTPLFRSSVGFDRFNDLFESAFNGVDNVPNYPPYNIVKQGDDKYEITLAVAGFKDKDVQIVANGNSLTVTGKVEEKTSKEDDKDGAHFLHRGIATRSFERKFSLADHVVVKEAALQDGLLQIKLERIVPEELKPRIIPVRRCS